MHNLYLTDDQLKIFKKSSSNVYIKFSKSQLKHWKGGF